jgi:hypothetical protein
LQQNTHAIRSRSPDSCAKNLRPRTRGSGQQFGTLERADGTVHIAAIEHRDPVHRRDFCR